MPPLLLPPEAEVIDAASQSGVCSHPDCAGRITCTIVWYRGAQVPNPFNPSGIVWRWNGVHTPDLSPEDATHEHVVAFHQTVDRLRDVRVARGPYVYRG